MTKIILTLYWYFENQFVRFKTVILTYDHSVAGKEKNSCQNKLCQLEFWNITKNNDAVQSSTLTNCLYITNMGANHLHCRENPIIVPAQEYWQLIVFLRHEGWKFSGKSDTGAFRNTNRKEVSISPLLITYNLLSTSQFINCKHF